jgi:hypothetical protein
VRAVLSVAFLMVLVGTAVAEPGVLSRKKLLLADAASDACLARCADQNASCKRVCPTTLSTPCLSGCDIQAQTCRQNCQSR